MMAHTHPFPCSLIALRTLSSHPMQWMDATRPFSEAIWSWPMNAGI
jgi:hypothetical protein